jgi:tRNA uridine 5-carbamoylmethylation protein Kti12
MNSENNEIFKNDFYKIYTFLICGIPAIGKSFFCKKLIEEIKKENQLNYNFEIIYLSFDKIENINENNYLQFQQMRDDFLIIFNEKINYCLENLNHKNYMILLDDNFFLKSMRKKIYNSFIDKIFQFEKNDNYNFFYSEIFLKCNNLEFVLNNNKKRKEKIPENIIKRMNEIFEYESPYIKNTNQKIILIENEKSLENFDFTEILKFENTIERKNNIEKKSLRKIIKQN